MSAEHPTAAELDAVTPEALVAAGHLKWTRHPGCLGAWIAEMDYGTAPAIAHALRSSIDRHVTGYLPDGLATDLAAACADHQGEAHGWSVDAAQIRLVGDVLQGLRVAIEQFSRPGSPAVLPLPSYMPFLALPGDLGRELLVVPMVEVGGRWSLDLDALDRAFAAGGHLLILCNPHNPLGAVATADELGAIAEIVDRRDGLVFADEIHGPIVHPGARHVPYASLSAVTAGHTITATSASKAWNLPGLKCAEVILTRDDDDERWDALPHVAVPGPSNPGVVASTAAFRDAGPWLAAVLDHLDGNRRLFAELVAEHLPGAHHSPPEGTYLAWVDCRDLGLPEDLGAFFRDRASVALTDGAACGAPDHVRVNLATPRPILTRIVEQMGEAVATRDHEVSDTS